MARLRYNGLATGSSGSTVGLSLGASLTSGATSVTFNAALTHSNGTAVPTITGSDYIPLEILDANGRLSEIVYLTAYTAAATTGTISRGNEGTTGIAHSSGDKIVCSALAGDVTPVRDARWSPLSGQVGIDEFNDSSLDAAWTRVDGTGAASANVVYTEDADVLSVKQEGGDTAGCIHGIVRTLTGFGGSLAAGDGFITRSSLAVTPSVNFAMFGLVLSDGTTFGSGNQVVGLGYAAATAATAFNLDCRDFTSWNTNSSTVGAVAAPYPFIRFQRLALISTGVWRHDWSPDGVSWIKGTATLSKTMTATHVGFLSSSWGTSTKSVVGYDFLRRVSGVT